MVLEVSLQIILDALLCAEERILDDMVHEQCPPNEVVLVGVLDEIPIIDLCDSAFVVSVCNSFKVRHIESIRMSISSFLEKR